MKKTLDLGFSGHALKTLGALDIFEHPMLVKKFNKVEEVVKKNRFFLITFLEVNKTRQKCHFWALRAETILSFFCPVLIALLNLILGALHRGVGFTD